MIRYLPLLFLLGSCSKSWYCRHCLDGATTKTDTIIQIVKVPVPADSVDSLLIFDHGQPVTKEDSLEWMNWEATVPTTPIEIKDSTGRAEGSIQFKKNKQVKVDCKCKADTLKINVPQYITNTVRVKEGYTPWKVWVGAIVGGLAILFVGLFIGKILR